MSPIIIKSTMIILFHFVKLEAQIKAFFVQISIQLYFHSNMCPIDELVFVFHGFCLRAFNQIYTLHIRKYYIKIISAM